ncbi:divergent protein kinase domain 1C-like [Montipora capricornis]|uniref:divergent protein kinase domain 1C-like n=1 Tax=Montipora capricornis TaxID=246305 RepID=UPI0035F102DA
MRFRWKRNKKSLCCISLGLFSVTICWIFSNNVEVFGKQYTCEELRAEERVRQLCREYNRGITGGNLCNDLCKRNELVLQDCRAHKNTTIVFSGIWKNKSIVFKTKRQPRHFISLKDLIFTGTDYDGDKPAQNQGRILNVFTTHVFEHIIDQLSLEKLRHTMTPKRALKHLWHPHTMEKLSWADMSSLWVLIQRDEFIKLQLLQDMKHIPQVYGFCGTFYAVEKVDTLREEGFSLFKRPIPWGKRLRISLEFLELVQEFLTSRLGHLYHCDVQPANFGITKDMRVVALDIDSVFPTKLMKDFLEQPICVSDKQCDFFDCFSSCNQTVQHCTRNILTNNLQVICQNIFVSHWEQTGLLQRAPVSAQNKLSRVLTECASEKLLPWKHSKEQRIHKQLKKILTELATGKNR